MYVKVGVVVTVHLGVDQPQHVGVRAGEHGGRGDEGGGGSEVGLDVLQLLLLMIAVSHPRRSENCRRRHGDSLWSDGSGLAVLRHL